MNVARCCVAPNVNNLTHPHLVPLSTPPPSHALPRNVGQHLLARHFDNLWLFAFDLHCPKRHAPLLPTTTPTPLGKRWDPRLPSPCASLRLAVVFQMTAALRRCARPINFRHVTANYTFSIFAPHACYLSFLFPTLLSLFLFFPLYLSLQCRKLQINQAKRRPSKCTRPARTMTQSPARHCPACRRRASPTPMRAVNRNIL